MQLGANSVRQKSAGWLNGVLSFLYRLFFPEKGEIQEQARESSYKEMLLKFQGEVTVLEVVKCSTYGHISDHD